MVLVHGGGGTAFDVWVRLWNSRGYAAIAMDLCGCVPIGTYGHWQRHPAGGPPGWGGFDQIDWPAHDQWTYHAVADVLLAHSLLRSLPEIDPRADRRDRHFLGRIPDLHRGGRRPAVSASPCPSTAAASSATTPPGWAEFKRLGPEKAGRWLSWWDPSVYLRQAQMPMLWVTGTNDFAYPMDSLQKSYRLPTRPADALPAGADAARPRRGGRESGRDPRLCRRPVGRWPRRLTKITGQGRAGRGSVGHL